MQNTTFAAAMKQYFGLLPGQTLTDFINELKALTPADKAWFKANLPSVGFNIIEPAKAA